LDVRLFVLLRKFSCGVILDPGLNGWHHVQLKPHLSLATCSQQLPGPARHANEQGLANCLKTGKFRLARDGNVLEGETDRLVADVERHPPVGSAAMKFGPNMPAAGMTDEQMTQFAAMSETEILRYEGTWFYVEETPLQVVWTYPDGTLEWS
jgi:hypothetical protein